MFLVGVSRIFKIVTIAPVVKPLFDKVSRESSSFYNSVENSTTCIDIFRKVALLEISMNSFSTGVTNLESTGTLLETNS